MKLAGGRYVGGFVIMLVRCWVMEREPVCVCVCLCVYGVI